MLFFLFPAEPVRAFLAWSAFRAGARLTYCAYLLHPIILIYVYMGAKTPFVVDKTLMVSFCAQFGHINAESEGRKLRDLQIFTIINPVDVLVCSYIKYTPWTGAFHPNKYFLFCQSIAEAEPNEQLETNSISGKVIEVIQTSLENVRDFDSQIIFGRGCWSLFKSVHFVPYKKIAITM